MEMGEDGSKAAGMGIAYIYVFKSSQNDRETVHISHWNKVGNSVL